MRKILSAAVCIAIIICFTPTAFAENYTTQIKGFTYNGYTIPSYDGDSVEKVNGNVPKFSNAEKTKKAKIQYGDLDGKGRCTAAFADLNQSLMPTGSRGSISSVYPTGWVQVKYDCVPGKWLFNRCHLIGWQLSAADLNTLSKAELSKNLITGTRFLNVGSGKDGMVGYENIIADYIKANKNNYVAYRVTPVFTGTDLLAKGVLMEGQSLGDDKVKFCVFCYNVQPGIAIDYATGKSKIASAVSTKSIGNCNITLSKKSYEYTGKQIKPGVTIKNGGTTLKNGTDYKVSYKSNTLPGKASVQIAGLGKYNGSSLKYFIIFPDKAKISKTTQAKTSITVTLAGNKGVTGYQYAYKKKADSKWKTLTVSAKSKKISKLKRKTVYQVKARAYKKVSGNRYYGKWSVIKNVKTK